LTRARLTSAERNPPECQRANPEGHRGVPASTRFDRPLVDGQIENRRYHARAMLPIHTRLYEPVRIEQVAAPSHTPVKAAESDG